MCKYCEILEKELPHNRKKRTVKRTQKIARGAESPVKGALKN